MSVVHQPEVAAGAPAVTAGVPAGLLGAGPGARFNERPHIARRARPLCHNFAFLPATCLLQQGLPNVVQVPGLARVFVPS